MLARVLCCAFLFCNAANAAIIKVNDDSYHPFMEIGSEDTLLITAGAVENIELSGGRVEIHNIGASRVIHGFGTVIVTGMQWDSLLLQGTTEGPMDVSIQALSMRAPFDPMSNDSSADGWLTQDMRARITIAPAFADCLGRCEDTVVKNGDTTTVSWVLRDDGNDRSLGSVTLTNEIPWGWFSTDEDGIIDLAELNFVRNAFGSTDGGIDATYGDMNADGVVDLYDLNWVRNHFGETMWSMYTLSQLEPVPEPSTLLLTALGMCVLASAPLRCRCCSSTAPSP